MSTVAAWRRMAGLIVAWCVAACGDARSGGGADEMLGGAQAAVRWGADDSGGPASDWVVRLAREKVLPNGEFDVGLCTGFLATPQIVLTSAVCVQQYGAVDVGKGVGFGAILSTGHLGGIPAGDGIYDDTTYRVSAYVTSFKPDDVITTAGVAQGLPLPGGSGTPHIAILVLDRRVDFARALAKRPSFAGPDKLVTNPDGELASWSNGRIVGWGVIPTGEVSFKFPSRRQTLRHPLVSLG